MRPIVLSIAGSDCSGGAGVQADLKSIEASGGYAATVVTVITAQNTRRVFRSETLSAHLVRDQIDAVFEDLEVAAVKTGLLGNAAVIRTVADSLRQRPTHLVCDPVTVSGSGFRFLDDEALSALRRDLLPLASLITPNVLEAELLSGVTIRDLRQAESAATRLLDEGARAVLITGGHLDTDRGTDLLVTPESVTRVCGEWIETRNTHGSGCTYASAIATRLARGYPLTEAVRDAKEFVVRAIRGGLPVGQGAGPLDPFHAGIPEG